MLHCSHGREVLMLTNDNRVQAVPFRLGSSNCKGSQGVVGIGEGLRR